MKTDGPIDFDGNFSKLDSLPIAIDTDSGAASTNRTLEVFRILKGRS
jgi:hypothetical protein